MNVSYHATVIRSTTVCLHLRRGWTYLDLRNSNITVLPTNLLEDLSELSLLLLSNNRLVGLPYNTFIGLSKLTLLDIGDNYLAVLPGNIFKDLLELTHLIMYNNNIIYLPNDIFNGLSNLTYLDLYKNKITFLPYNVFNGLTNLRVLSLRWNNILTLPPNVFSGLSQLSYLDLYNNNLVFIPYNILSGLSKLRRLFLNNNDIILLPDNLFNGLSELQYLDLSHNNIAAIPFNLFMGLSKLTDLYLHCNNLVDLPNDVFVVSNSIGHQNLLNNESAVVSPLPENLLRVDLALNSLVHLPRLPRTLSEINIRGNNIKVTENMFKGLYNLTKILTANLFVCCVKPTPETECFEPISSLQTCHRNPDTCRYKGHAISSCYALISSYILKTCLWIIGICALTGNLAVIVYRIFFDRENITKNYSMFTLNLAISDLLMGIYLLIIGMVDAHYNGVYAWNDQKWRKSILCTTAGILSSVSSEMSTFLILMVSVDRLIVIMFPLSRLSRRSISWRMALIVSVLFWIVSVTLAIIPTVTLQSYFKGEFYSQSSVCLALPLTKDIQSGTEYSFAVFVYLNSIIFTIIVVCQICIFKSIRTSGRRVTSSQNRQRETNVAITLFFVVVTDFCCWCPIGIMGLASRYRVEIPGGVYAWVMVFVLPINAAINPFLYTATAIWRRRQKITTPLPSLKPCYEIGEKISVNHEKRTAVLFY
ncbi:G-protein coupled receptor GRL101-like [Pecten maximus]|uniref:G-protein coupled receptor GRL101-like n=1 Tax=Pecten maximus TaxID=6579 RepID=UPI001457F3E9|nr:G-protein coupled receptor GRL101-like [Pecten maximus]